MERLTIYEFLFCRRTENPAEKQGEIIDSTHFSSEVTLVRLVHHLNVSTDPLITQFWPAIKEKVRWIKRTDWAMEGIFETDNFRFHIRPAKDLRPKADKTNL